MDNKHHFSERLGYAPTEHEIMIREDAPHELRWVLLELALRVGVTIGALRTVVCQVLRKRPNQDNYSVGFIRREVADYVDNTEWFRVYDIAEAVYRYLSIRDRPAAIRFQGELNKYFREVGIGWQMANGSVEVRGPESFEFAVHSAKETLQETNRITASSEIDRALQDLSRRPEPDLTGAVNHAMGALECVARDVCGDANATLGQILKRHANLVPVPLDTATAKVWGYASEKSRHIREGSVPEKEEAELVVGLAAILVTYLSKKSFTSE